MPRLMVVCLLVLIGSGCSLLRHQPHSAALPPVSAIACCFQSWEQIDINHQGQSNSLQAILLREQNSLQLVLLDALGRRLATIEQNATELLTHDSEISLPAPLLHKILQAVYLHWLSPPLWPEWVSQAQVVATADTRILLINKRPQMELRYIDSGSTVRKVTVSEQALSLTITTLKSQSL